MSIHYNRRFSADAKTETSAGAYIRPREVIDANEDELIAFVSRGIVADTHRLPKNAGKDDAAFHEPHWGHTTGLLRGTLAIDRVDALPAQFRVGLFTQNASYPALCRPQMVEIDRKRGFAFGRMSVKLKFPTAVPNVYAASGQAHELDLLFGEGSAQPNHGSHTFFFRDACEMSMFGTLQPPSWKTLGTLLSPRNWPVLARVIARLKKAIAFGKSDEVRAVGWAGKSYFSLGPFTLGDGAMKFCLRPRQTHPSTQPHRETFAAWMAAGKDAVFDLCVQLATSECIPEPGPSDPAKSVMTAEYCDLEWDESKSPYVPVGTLTLPASTQRELNEKYPWSPLQFNAWNTLPAMRPLGQTFRVRKHAHKASSEARLEHLYDAKPGAMVDQAPF